MPNLYRETPITLDAEKRSETGKRSGQTAPTGGRAGSVPVVKRGSGAPGWHANRNWRLAFGFLTPKSA